MSENRNRTIRFSGFAGVDALRYIDVDSPDRIRFVYCPEKLGRIDVREDGEYGFLLEDCAYYTQAFISIRKTFFIKGLACRSKSEFPDGIDLIVYYSKHKPAIKELTYANLKGFDGVFTSDDKLDVALTRQLFLKLIEEREEYGE